MVFNVHELHFKAVLLDPSAAVVERIPLQLLIFPQPFQVVSTRFTQDVEELSVPSPLIDQTAHVHNTAQILTLFGLDHDQVSDHERELLEICEKRLPASFKSNFQYLGHKVSFLS